MTQGITFSGLGSGLDTDAIIEQLVKLERRPIELIQTRQTRLGQQKEIIQSIASSLLTLQDSVTQLSSAEVFSVVEATSAASDRVAVSATNEAAAGSFSVEVVSLAQARRLSSRSFRSASEALGLSGEIVLNGRAVEIGTQDDLQDIRDRINDAELGVSAQILSVTAEDSRLILTADEVGSRGFDLRDASATNVLQALGYTASGVSVGNPFVNGGRSAAFLDSATSIASLLNLASPPAGTVTVGDREVSIDLATDSLEAIRDRINEAAPTGVTARVVSAVEQGLTRHRLEVEGTTNLIDDAGVLEALGVLEDGGIADPIVAGAESDAFASTSTAIGSLLGSASGPSGTVRIAGQEVAIDLASDSLTAVQTRINAAGIAGVTATVTSSTDADGNRQFRLRIEGTGDLVDGGNVLEALGLLVGSSNSFESVAQVVTSSVGNQEQGALLNPVSGGARSATFDSDSDAVGTLIGSSASGTVAIGGGQVSVDLASDSLTAIRDRINAAGIAGVTANINAVGPSSFELQVSGTTDFDDDGGVLEALGVVAAPGVMTAETRLGDILGAGVRAGDTISIYGTDHAGNQVAGSFTISSTNLKVQALLTAVQQAFGNRVSASVDGAGRIVVADEEAGRSSLALTLEANNEGGGSLSLGTLSTTTQGSNARTAELQAGQDAFLRINGIALTRSTNTITDAVQGLTLDLKKAEEGEVVEITVRRDDTTTLRGQIQSFVDDFNAAMDLINEQFVLDEKTKKGGPLSGDSTLMGLQAQLRAVVSTQIEGLAEEYNALVLIGISFDRNGRLTVDDERLSEALAENLDAVRRLFVAEGSATDGGISYISSNARTHDGTYGVSVTQAAARAQLAGTLQVTLPLAGASTLALRDLATGQVARVALDAGSDLDQIVARINEGLGSDVAEVRRATLGNTVDGTVGVTADTPFAQIYGAGVQAGDTIRISGTTHGGTPVTRTFTVADPESDTVGDLLSAVRTAFGGAVSVTVDAEGRIAVTDNQVGASELTVTLVEANEGGGTLDFGSIDVEVEGRTGLEITAAARDGRLVLEHSGYGTHNGFEVSEAVAALGLEAGTVRGRDVQGTIGGQEADGFGRILTGRTGSDDVEGLSLRVELTDEDLTDGGLDRGTVTLVYGVARRLGDALEGITDDYEGSLLQRQRTIDTTVSDLDDQIASMERRVEQYRTNLVTKFAALEGTISTLQTQGNFLSSQLASLTNQNKR
ncbi:MAG: flagellar filament capping protein FliD [Candidatus Latescibacterota bacterium]